MEASFSFLMDRIRCIVEKAEFCTEVLEWIYICTHPKGWTI